MRKLSTKTSNISLWKKYGIIVSLNSKSGLNLERSFDIPTTTLITVSKVNAK